ncbi:peptidyl-prolyl cis-trans isomerase FKBP19, chloroplastic isoform X5 [Cajanus cajan]|uniref:peptidyl-prolyl cis-trans isomerase FKBP19, chloroplastic isoform X5 n=1 Tax=Cajanus cajan TaxID=3821 RepID=UPI00098D9245|nr:peptidyl-prolyl cis-trans isomerase FKBP19, chloroplastic isoform X5 [Cajanus cajan]
MFPSPNLNLWTLRKSLILFPLAKTTAGVEVVVHHHLKEERCFSLPSALLLELCATVQGAESLWQLNLPICQRLEGRIMARQKCDTQTTLKLNQDSNIRIQDLRPGNGPKPKTGETVVVDWDGYTIGYYGRIFEARNKTKGGSFEGDDKDFFKFKVGSNEVIPAFEEAISGMALGGVRRIIVPPELGYPENDYNKSGPRPTTFSGQRALDFVLRNQGLIDKTLLFDIELLKIIPN